MQDILFAQQRGDAAHLLEPAADRAARPTLGKPAECAVQGQIVLPQDASELGEAGPGTRTVAARIKAKKAACDAPSASVVAWERPAIRVFIRSTRETARSTSPSGHEAIAR